MIEGLNVIIDVQNKKKQLDVIKIIVVFFVFVYLSCPAVEHTDKN